MKYLRHKLVFFIIVFVAGIGYANEPYYGFYPSKMGVNYKLLRHNIFNFELDIPKDWIFGVAGSTLGQVILIYPEGFNTAKFAPSYETISIGIIPITGITLVKAYDYILLGMSQNHNGLMVIKEKTIAAVGNNKAINFIYTWPSKTGNIVKENVFLVKYRKRIYSITIRTIEPIFWQQKKTHEEIVNTFKPIEPVQF